MPKKQSKRASDDLDLGDYQPSKTYSQLLEGGLPHKGGLRQLTEAEAHAELCRMQEKNKKSH